MGLGLSAQSLDLSFRIKLWALKTPSARFGSEEAFEEEAKTRLGGRVVRHPAGVRQHRGLHTFARDQKNSL